MMLAHVHLMLAYNARLNRQLYDGAARLDDTQIRTDRGAYFGSVLGTLNHLMVADLIWLARFPPAFPHFTTLAKLDTLPQPRALDEILYIDFNELRQAREQLDRILDEWGHQDLRADDLEQDLVYANRKGITSIRNFGEVLMHLFNHQTHHRGQASTLLCQCGIDIGITDFLIDIPDRAAI